MILAAGAVAVAMAATGCGTDNSQEAFNAAPSGGPAATPGLPERLFVLSASGGLLADGTLTLTGVKPDAVWFDERPARRAGREATNRFVQRWALAGFVSDPPNAALQIAGDPPPLPVILELGQPVQGDDTLTFPISGPPAAAVPAFGPCSLFIDAAQPSFDSQTLEFLVDVAPPGGATTVVGIQVAGGLSEVGFSCTMDDSVNFTLSTGDPTGQDLVQSLGVTPEALTLILAVPSLQQFATISLQIRLLIEKGTVSFNAAATGASVAMQMNQRVFQLGPAPILIPVKQGS